MSTQPFSIRELVPADALLRALRNSKQAQDLHEAFLLRADERESGLSVNFDCTADECRSQFSKTYGVARLTVQSVRELALEVVPDRRRHANIKGIPHVEDDPLQAEWFASKLAECAKIISSGLIKCAAVQPLDD
jgi:hypothetical protein